MLENKKEINEKNKQKKEKTLFLISIITSTVATAILSIYHNTLHFAYEYFIFAVFYFILGKDVFIEAFNDFKSRKFMRESFLMTVATLGAAVIDQTPEALAVLIFFKIGAYFENRAVNTSKKTIASLVSLRAETANIVGWNGEIKTVKVETVEVDDFIKINPFEKVPLDCIILEGNTWVDTKALTGESMPRDVKEGDEILSGMINGEYTVKARVIRTYSKSSIAKILELVEESASRKAGAEKFISRFASIYTPIVVFSAVAIAIIPPLILGFRENFLTWVSRSLTLLVISCPCAFVVGIPLTFFASIGRASKMGVILKGGVFIDLLAKLDTIAFDKTGTLTKGEFSINKMYNAGIVEDSVLIKLSAYAEYNSSHPIAKSIVKHYEEMTKESINTKNINILSSIASLGINAKVEGRDILIGTKKLLTSNKINVPVSVDNNINVYVAIDNKYAGGFVVDDTLKPETISTIRELKKMKINTALLSGDKKERVEEFARNIEIDNYQAECMPEDKVSKFESIMSGSKVSAFVGDGINDSPVLARADIGIAMGGIGSDAAVENADIVLMDDKISKIVDVIKLAKDTKGVVYFNLAFAFLVKIITIILGVFGYASMWMAIFADTGVTVIVVFNAIRLLYPLGSKEDRAVVVVDDGKGCSCCNH